MKITTFRTDPDPNLWANVQKPKVEMPVKQLELEFLQFHTQFKDRLFTDLTVKIDI